MKRLGSALLALFLVSACAGATRLIQRVAPSPSVAPSEAAIPPIQAGLVRHEMPNLGLALRLPATWVTASDATEDDIAVAMEQDPNAEVIARNRQEARTARGGDTGIFAVDRATGAVIVASFDPDLEPSEDISAAYRRRLAGYENASDVTAPPALAETVVFGKPAPTLVLRARDQGGDDRTVIRVGFRLPSGEAIELSYVGLTRRIGIGDLAPILKTIEPTGNAPAGAAFRPRWDASLTARLENLNASEQWLVRAGDRYTMEMLGLLGDPLITTALETVEELMEDPDLLRAGRAYSTDSDDGSWPQVSAVRVYGVPAPDWGPLEGRFRDVVEEAGQRFEASGPIRAWTHESGMSAGRLVYKGDAVFLVRGTVPHAVDNIVDSILIAW